VLTSLPEPGTQVAPGQILYAVDGQPVVAMAGTIPAWRTLKYGVDDGADVAQVEQNLVDLGFADADELTVDSTWTWVTTAAVRRWQHALGLEQSGIIELGRVVFVPGTRRVSAVDASLGQQALPGATVLSTTALTRTINVELDARRQHLVEPGMEVSVTLPDSTVVPATMKTVGSVAATAVDRPDDPPSVTVTLTLTDPSTAGSLDGATVKVSITTEMVTGVLAVPVNALLATASRGYAVEVVHEGRVEVVPVTLGLFAGGWVELASGDVGEGDRVVVPS
jgi:multidrug efflux pump subunit AcrA (membrane-fusion protein)